MDETGQPGPAGPGENANGAGPDGNSAQPSDGWVARDETWSGGESTASAGDPSSPWARPPDPPAAQGWADTLSRFGRRPVTLPAALPLRRPARQSVNGTHLDERTAPAASQPEPRQPVSAPPYSFDGDREEGSQQRMIVPAPRPSGDRPATPHPDQAGSGPQSPRSRAGEPGQSESARHASDDSGQGGSGHASPWRDRTSSMPASGPPSGGAGPVSAPPSGSGTPPGFRPAQPYDPAGRYDPGQQAYDPGQAYDPAGGYEQLSPPYPPSRPYEAAGYEPATGYGAATGYEAAPGRGSGYEPSDYDPLRAGHDRSEEVGRSGSVSRSDAAAGHSDPAGRSSAEGADEAPGEAAGPAGAGSEPIRFGARRAREGRAQDRERTQDREIGGSRILRSVPDPEPQSTGRAGGDGRADPVGRSADGGTERDRDARDWSSSWAPSWATEPAQPEQSPRNDWASRWARRSAPEPSAPVQNPHPGPSGSHGYQPRNGDPSVVTRAAEAAGEALPQRVPAEPDVPTVPEPPAVEPPAETPELARIATHLRREDASPEMRERPEGFDVNAILAAVRGVEGVRDASLRRTPAGAHSLRLELADGADPAEVSRQVARLLQERMGLAAAPQNLSGPASPAAGPGGPQPARSRGSGGHAEIPPDVPRRRRQSTASRGPAPVEDRGSAPVEKRGSAEPAAAAAPSGLLGPGTNSPLTAGTSYSGGQLTTTETAPSRPLNPGKPPGPRVVIDHVQVSTFGLDATVEVRLGAGEQQATGLASGPAVDGYVLRLCAVAAAAAIDELLRSSTASPGRGRCFVEHAAVVPFGSCEVATVVVLLVCDGWVEQLAGSALVSGDPRQAVVRAALAAVNRRLEALLA